MADAISEMKILSTQNQPFSSWATGTWVGKCGVSMDLYLTATAKKSFKSQQINAWSWISENKNNQMYLIFHIKWHFAKEAKLVYF